MLVAVLTVLVLFIFVQIISFISWRDMKRRRKSYIREKFGRIPKAGEWNENRKDFCSLFPEEISVDDITWNDLSMDQVFDRINQCDTSAGEEILYWRLRKNDPVLAAQKERDGSGGASIVREAGGSL